MKKFLALLLSTMMVLGMAGTFASAEETGSVYYLNFKPEAEEAWQALAKTYTELTGVPVTVVTAASGTYSETLTVEMDKGASAPTLFQCGNQQGLDTWGDYCLDLRDTDFYKELTTEEFNLFGDNGEAFAVGYCYEAFGIIVNKALLAEEGLSLFQKADRKKRILRYEASVAGAVPIVEALKESLTGNRIQSLMGILNGTSNYILSEMTSNGLDFDVALKQAQQLGYAEADPTLDIDGHDAAHKLILLIRLAFGANYPYTCLLYTSPSPRD